jgi:hypothetical protein
LTAKHLDIAGRDTPESSVSRCHVYLPIRTRREDRKTAIRLPIVRLAIALRRSLPREFALSP